MKKATFDYRGGQVVLTSNDGGNVSGYTVGTDRDDGNGRFSVGIRCVLCWVRRSFAAGNDVSDACRFLGVD